YCIDINTLGEMDFVKVYVPNGQGGEVEVLDYDYAPMAGVLPIYTANSTFRVEYLGATEGYSELFKGFKINFHPMSDSLLLEDKVFYNNVGIGIYPKERLHINGFVRGDGIGGALRVKTTSGITEFGAQSTEYSHFKTDRPAYLFDKTVTLTDGKLRSYKHFGNTAPLSLCYGDSTIISLTDKAVLMNAPLQARLLRIDTIRSTASKVVIPDSVAILGPIRGGQTSGSLRVKTDNGFVDIGSTHPGFMHFYTDRPKFYFDKPISINSGVISSIERVDLQLQTFNTTHLRIQYGTGNVGIGTDNPEYKLDVNGVIRATGMKVRTSTGADFVFDADYKLKSLLDLEHFISTHGHLPEIPSAEEMKEEGIDVNEMQIKLLQKIEELTLYIIKQDKQIQALQETVEELSK
ncbi:MAG: hypothetical protein IJT12_02235, partial [Paludibacteraceae bacterium]|nr:hypothetical protein [Paludibacteraceae bacterium]